MNKLLMTGTINPGVYNNTGVVICNVSDRLHQYESAIERYIKFSNFDCIIFADNSEYNFDYIKFENMAQKYNKHFEFLSLKGYYYENVEFGKSYGESRLITDAINRSKLIKNNDTIFKVTGRIYIRNINKLIKCTKNHDNVFISENNRKRVLTNFFKVNVRDYEKNLKLAYIDCDDKKGDDIEKAFYYRLIGSNLKVKSFIYYPDMDGIVGTTGNEYNKSKCNIIVRSMLGIMGMYTLRDEKSKRYKFDNIILKNITNLYLRVLKKV